MIFIKRQQIFFLSCSFDPKLETKIGYKLGEIIFRFVIWNVEEKKQDANWCYVCFDNAHCFETNISWNHSSWCMPTHILL